MSTLRRHMNSLEEKVRDQIEWLDKKGRYPILDVLLDAEERGDITESMFTAMMGILLEFVDSGRVPGEDKWHDICDLMGIGVAESEGPYRQKAEALYNAWCE